MSSAAGNSLEQVPPDFETHVALESRIADWKARRSTICMADVHPIQWAARESFVANAKKINDLPPLESKRKRDSAKEFIHPSSFRETRSSRKAEESTRLNLSELYTHLSRIASHATMSDYALHSYCFDNLATLATKEISGVQSEHRQLYDKALKDAKLSIGPTQELAFAHHCFRNGAESNVSVAMLDDAKTWVYGDLEQSVPDQTADELFHSLLRSRLQVVEKWKSPQQTIPDVGETGRHSRTPSPTRSNWSGDTMF